MDHGRQDSGEGPPQPAGPHSPHGIPTSHNIPSPRSGDPRAHRRPVALVLWEQEERGSARQLTCRPAQGSQPPHLAETRPGSELGSPVTVATLSVWSRWTSRHDSSRAWGRPYHGQGAQQGKQRAPQLHPLSPMVPNPPHTEQEVGARVGLEAEPPPTPSDLLGLLSQMLWSSQGSPPPPCAHPQLSKICQTWGISEGRPSLRHRSFFSMFLCGLSLESAFYNCSQTGLCRPLVYR